MVRARLFAVSVVWRVVVLTLQVLLVMTTCLVRARPEVSLFAMRLLQSAVVWVLATAM